MENGPKDLFYQMQDVPDDRRRRYRPRLDVPSGLPPVIRNEGGDKPFYNGFEEACGSGNTSIKSHLIYNQCIRYYVLSFPAPELIVYL